MDWPVCGKCEKSVETAEGAVDISEAEVKDARAAILEREKEGGGVRVYNLAEFLALPGSAKWRWGHINCWPADGYWFRAEDIDSPIKALSMTLHLMEKEWVRYTDWPNFLRTIYPGV